MKKKKILAVTGTALMLVGILGTTALAEGGARRDNIKSHGNIDVQNGAATIYSSDFTYLADEIDTLENAYKTNTVAALNVMGTYYDGNGAVTHNQDEEGITSEAAINLSFSQIYDGVLNSQSVAHLADQQATDGTGSLLYYADEAAKNDNNLVTTTTTANDFPLLIQPITADNLTAGTAAWVDGSLIIGNGADNQAYYAKGYLEGYDNSVENIAINYQYHSHKDNNGNTDLADDYIAITSGGCFTTAVTHLQPSTAWCSAGDWKSGLVYNGFEYESGYICNKCGHQTNSQDSGHSYITYTRVIDGYKKSCGRTTATIESATIVFN